MGWLYTGFLAFALGTAAQATPDPHVHPTHPDEVVANCDDFVEIADAVFTGRTGAWFGAGRTRAYLGGDTFGPNALTIGGIDPARYLQRRCGH